jgi:release factor glutamine methyltransferase
MFSIAHIVNLKRMRTDKLLSEMVAKLEAANVPSARLDCLVLLEDITGKDRSWLLAHPEYKLTSSQVRKLESWVKRRAGHEPLAYIRGITEFYGREFFVSPHTLEPRPESETMIALLKHLALEPSSTIIDVGTGSGCLAITAKQELPDVDVIATDISAPALKIAKKNAKKHDADIDFYRGNLLLPIPAANNKKRNAIIVANLPYVPLDHTINQAAMHEPKIAIFGGQDGLDLYRELFLQIATISQFVRVGHVLTESLPPQHTSLAKIARDAGFELYKTDDFIQVFKNIV